MLNSSLVGRERWLAQGIACVGKWSSLSYNQSRDAYRITKYLLLLHASIWNCFRLAMPSFPIPSFQSFKFAPHGVTPTSVACSVVCPPVICLITRCPAFPKPAKMVKCFAAKRTSCVPLADPGIYTRLVEKMFAW